MLRKILQLIIMLLFTAALFFGCGENGTSKHKNKKDSSFGDVLVPEAPANINATCGDSIKVDWDMEPGLCYNLYWNTTVGVTTSDNEIENVLPPYTHTGLIYNGTTNYYAVTAYDCTELTESGLSAEVSAAPFCGVLDSPANMSATAGKSITVDWDTVPGLCYNLYWNTTGGVTTSDNKVDNVLPPYEHTGLIYDGALYYYAATAYDCAELTESGLSAEVSAAAGVTANELSKLTATDTEDFDQFGYSVSISGDYAIAGAKQEDGAGTDRGAAYVFYRDQGGPDNWGQVTKLTASDAEDSDWFGKSVSISGDYVIVGAPLEDGTGTNRGAAYVFYRNQGGTDIWGQVIKLTASDTEDYDIFGESVSISGDYVIVGASGKDGAGTARGAAYVFYRKQGGTDNWGEVSKLTASDAEDYDFFGYSVSISGDYTIVGAYWEDGSGSDRGAAYVFYRNQGGTDNWGEVTKLIASDTADGDNFGFSVSISGDYAIVGAWRTGTDRGAAYVFSRNQGGADNWGEVTKLTASDAEDGDEFGISAALSGDYAVVGAEGETGDGGPWAYRGAAYVFYRNQGGADNWGEVRKLTSSDTEDVDWFGGSVAICGEDIIIGAFGEDGAGGYWADRGAAYLF